MITTSNKKILRLIHNGLYAVVEERKKIFKDGFTSEAITSVEDTRLIPDLVNDYVLAQEAANSGQE